jgi:hypothetical protein
MAKFLDWVRNILKRMELQPEDYVTVAVTLSLFASWFILMFFFGLVGISLWVYWGGMTVMSVWYSYTYFKKKRDPKLYKIRFVCSSMPNYIAFGVYGYALVVGIDISQELRWLPLWVVIILFAVNALIFYLYPRRKSIDTKARVV